MPATFVEFLIAAIVMEITPGPNMTWLALLSAREGRMAGFMAVAGIALGLTLLAIIAATGAAALISTYPAIYEFLRWGGVLFLLYLAWEAWVDETKEPTDNQGRYFVRGVIVNLLNPKSAAVFIVMIPSFAGAGNTLTQITMTVIYLCIATLAHALIVAFAGSFQKALSNPQRERIVRRIFAFVLVGVAIWLAFTTGRPT